MFLRFVVCVIFLLGNFSQGQHTSFDVSNTKDKASKKILFFFYDAGETLAFLPVYRSILTNGVHSPEIVSLTPWVNKILLKKSITHKSFTLDSEHTEHVEQRSRETDITIWKNIVQDSQPDLVIVGMVSTAQKQIANFCRSLDITVVGYNDGFDLKESSIVWDVAASVDYIWVASREIQTLMKKKFDRVFVVGQPTLETWHNISSNTNPTSIRDIHNLSNYNGKIILFAGQYGNGYKEVFSSFLQSLPKDKYQIIVSPHPKTKGELEKEVIQQQERTDAILADSSVSTSEVAVIADVIVTWTSTVGTQAIFAGKNVIYFGLKEDGYSNKLIEKQMAYYTTPHSLSLKIIRVLNEDNSTDNIRKKLKNLGFVISPTEKIQQEIFKILSKK